MWLLIYANTATGEGRKKKEVNKQNNIHTIKTNERELTMDSIKIGSDL